MTDEREELRYLPLTLKQWKKLYGAKAINNSWRSIGPRPPEHHTDAECEVTERQIAMLKGSLFDARKERDELKAQYMELSNEANNALDDIEELKAKLDDENNTIIRLSAECLCLRAEVERLRKELEGQRNIGLMAAGLGGERRPTPKKEAQK